MTVIEVREEKSTFSVSYFFFSPSRLIERRDLFSLRLRRPPLFNSRLSSPASATQMLTAMESFTQQNTPDSIRMLMWKFTCLRRDRRVSPASRPSREGGGGEAAGSLCGEFCRVQYVMKSFAGATERLTLPRMSRRQTSLTVHTYDTCTQMGFLHPSARGEGGRDESETMHSFRH